ncbi:MAG TPA: Asp-tRNA(Asn)/Glu-tRNA(Gln) amidotransferase GatCAB subunit B, partial [Firmicutes bacterium]|nr:Asp-tRNA(Asn)/Glu-tRNA(Gln) amidotransferase GatCAB subunit B [Bacillota bacterium]
KNMNSFRAVQRGLEYEIERQREVLARGEEVIPETRHFDEASGTTSAMRSKYKSADYRCFPDPNILPLEIEAEWIDRIAATLPELPDARYQRFIDLGLPPYDAEVLTSSKELADFFDATLEHYSQAKNLSNWLMGDFLRLLKEAGQDISQSLVTPANLARLLTLVDNGTISGKIAKEVFAEIFATGKDAAAIIEEKGLTQISDVEALEKLAAAVIAQNPASVSDFKNGKDKALGFLVGQVMKATRGKANPKLANEILLRRLKEEE